MNRPSSRVELEHEGGKGGSRSPCLSCGTGEKKKPVQKSAGIGEKKKKKRFE